MHALTVPAGALRDGENELLIAGSKADDVVIHSVALVEDALPSMRALRISVAEAGGAGAGGGGMTKIPARITITDGNGSLAALSVANATNLTRLAARPGVVYTADGSAGVRMAKLAEKVA